MAGVYRRHLLGHGLRLFIFLTAVAAVAGTVALMWGFQQAAGWFFLAAVTGGVITSFIMRIRI